MNLSEYQTISARTAPTDLCDKERRTNAAWGLIGEFGEVVDLLKKGRFQGASKCGCQHPDVEDFFYINNICLNCSGDGINQAFRDRLRDEFGDVMWYLAECFSVCGWTMFATKVSTSSSVCGIAYIVASDALDVEEGTAKPIRLVMLAGEIVRLIEDHGFTLGEVLEHNVAKLRKRYPQGFSVAASINRGAT